MKLYPIIFYPDTHVPYHDKKAFALVNNVARFLKPAYAVLQGDFADFYAVSSHDKSPDRKAQLEWEVEQTNLALDDIDRAVGRSCKKIFIAGNHENRLERYIASKAPELFGLLKIPELFRLRARGYQYVPYKADTRIGKLYATHDTGPAGRTAVFKNLDTYQHNIVTGHTHRIAYVVEGNAKGEAHVSASFGWLGDKAKTDYMHKVKANRDWALGFGHGWVREDGIVHLVPVPIINYTCVVNGKLFKL